MRHLPLEGPSLPLIVARFLGKVAQSRKHVNLAKMLGPQRASKASRSKLYALAEGSKGRARAPGSGICPPGS